MKPRLIVKARLYTARTRKAARTRRQRSRKKGHNKMNSFIQSANANANENYFARQSMVWNGMENGMERKFRYGFCKMPEWNEMEDFKNGMEDNLPYFHTNSILDFVHCIYRKIHTDRGGHSVLQKYRRYFCRYFVKKVPAVLYSLHF